MNKLLNFDHCDGVPVQLYRVLLPNAVQTEVYKVMQAICFIFTNKAEFIPGWFLNDFGAQTNFNTILVAAPIFGQFFWLAETAKAVAGSLRCSQDMTVGDDRYQTLVDTNHHHAIISLSIYGCSNTIPQYAHVIKLLLHMLLLGLSSNQLTDPWLLPWMLPNILIDNLTAWSNQWIMSKIITGVIVMFTLGFWPKCNH